MKIELDRREFLKGCCATATVGAVGPALCFGNAAHAAVNSYDTVVHVFLRGGIDGLNLVVPVAGNDRAFYEEGTDTAHRVSECRPLLCQRWPAGA